jgi:pimeloyl-ACP methyl ester carboxylesterase
MGAITGPAKSNKGTVIFLHGAPTQSYSYRVVLAQVSIGHTHFWRLWNFVYLKGSAVFRAISVKWKVQMLLLHMTLLPVQFLRIVCVEQMAKAGYHCYAPDWLGFGFSEKPQPDYDFSYTGTYYYFPTIEWHWVWTFVFWSSLLSYVETELF